MRVYRLAKARYIHDLSGMGARTAGGRWNRKGTAVLYTAPNRALAVVEFLVHIPFAILPRGLKMATLEIPDAAPRASLSIDDLPQNWKRYPPSPELARIGTDWVARNLHLVLVVPSAVVPGEHNLLINPAHPGMKHVKIRAVEAFKFDRRLLH